MKRRVIFLLEEPSMKAFLEEFLPRLVANWQHGKDYLLVSHEGKSDLEQSVRNKMRGWKEPGVRFVIVRDNDGGDCREVKHRLMEACRGREPEVVIRLVCQELEAWYLADAEALAQAYPESRRKIGRLVKRHPDPDACQKPSRELERTLSGFRKMEAARRMGRLLVPDRSRSASFRIFASAVLRLAGR